MKQSKLIAGFMLFILLPSLCAATEKLLIKGSGTSTPVVTTLFNLFSQQAGANGYEFDVEQASSKHSGGIKATDKHLFGRIGRPLNKAELALNKKQIIIGRIPIVFVVGKEAGVRKISIGQLTNILKGKINNWKTLGGNDHKIELVGREEKEVAFTELKKNFSFLTQIEFDKVFYRDNEITDYIRSDKGKYSLAFGTKPNFGSEYIMDVFGLSSGLEVGLVYDNKNSQHPLIKAIEAFVRSKEWHNALVFRELMPPNLPSSGWSVR